MQNHFINSDKIVLSIQGVSLEVDLKVYATTLNKGRPVIVVARKMNDIYFIAITHKKKSKIVQRNGQSIKIIKRKFRINPNKNDLNKYGKPNSSYYELFIETKPNAILKYVKTNFIIGTEDLKKIDFFINQSFL